MLGSALLHHHHNQLVGVTGVVCIGVNGRDFVLTGSRLVVLGLGQNTQPPKLLIQIPHKFGNTGTDGAEIVVIQFLTLGGQRAKKGAAGKPQVFPLGIHILGQQEILLLRAYTGHDSLCLGITE